MEMSEEELQKAVYEPYFILTMQSGLSPMEALCYTLVELLDVEPDDCSALIKDMSGRSIQRPSIITNVNRAKRKLRELESLS